MKLKPRFSFEERGFFMSAVWSISKSHDKKYHQKKYHQKKTANRLRSFLQIAL